MKQKAIFAAWILATLLAFAGCSVKTAQTLYRMPARTAQQENLDRVLTEAMEGREYVRFQSGESRESILARDLDADGQREYLVFARQQEQLQLLALAPQGQDYVLRQTISCPGTAFGRIDWIHRRKEGPEELMVWLTDSQGVLETVNIYDFSTGQGVQTLTGQAQAQDGQNVLYRLCWQDPRTPDDRPECTFAHYADGWFLTLPEQWAAGMTVTRLPGGFAFSLPGEEGDVKMFTIFRFTGSDRETQATEGNRFIIGRSDTAVYAAYLEVASGTIALTQEDLKSGFTVLNAGQT